MRPQRQNLKRLHALSTILGYGLKRSSPIHMRSSPHKKTHMPPMKGRAGGDAPSPLPNTSLCLRGVARLSRNPRVPRRYFQNTQARSRYFFTPAAGNRRNPLPWGCPHQVDSLSPLPPPGHPDMQPPPFALAHGTTGLDTSSRFICARNIGSS